MELDRSRKRTLPQDKATETNMANQVVMQSAEPSCAEYERIWKEFAALGIGCGLRFSFVEGQGFRKLCAVAFPPDFQVPSRMAIAKYSVEIYVDMRAKLQNNENPRVSLTIEKWTSPQTLTYTCLTTHWIDDNWKLQKRILNFLPIASYELGDMIKEWLLGWGINKVFSVTVDNVTANENAIEFPKTALKKSETNVVNWDHLYLRCVGQLVNKIVSEVLKDISSSVDAIRAALRYVLPFPRRLRKFQKQAEIDTTEPKKELSLDFPDKWNTTLKMLDAAEKYEGAFTSYEKKYSGFREYLSEENINGVPKASDWESVRRMVKVLNLFHEMTVETYGKVQVTSNKFFPTVTTVDSVLQEWKNSEDSELSSLAVRLKAMWDDYWGNPKGINKTVFISAVLDPTQKLGFVQFALIKCYGETRGKEFAKMVEEAAYELFNKYNSTEIISSASGEAEKSASDLDKYLAEDIEVDEQLDVLGWWKNNELRFPVLSRMARDVLAVPMSTLKSESAFNMDDRVLDIYHGNLPDNINQALMCSQDWLNDQYSSSTSTCFEDDLENASNDGDFENTCADHYNGNTSTDEDEVEDKMETQNWYSSSL